MGEKMEDMFKGYSNYSNEEYAEIWKEGMIVLDTNILLNFYRYSKETRDELYNTLKKLKKDYGYHIKLRRNTLIIKVM